MKSYRRLKGFSFLELMVVLAILGVLAALLFPIFSQSKRRGSITANVDRLHQCQLATALYQHDNDGGAGVPPYNLPVPGDWTESFSHHASFYGTDKTTWSSACGWHPLSKTQNFIVYAFSEQSFIQQFYARFGEHTMLLSDVNCNDSDVDVRSLFVTKLGLGVRIDGTLVRRIHQGNVDSLEFLEPVMQ